MAKATTAGGKSVAENRKARHEYEIEEEFEAGLVLTGTEVKSLRTGKANIAESYASPETGEAGVEIWLINSNIPEYRQGNRENHEPKRKRKLLLHKREANKLIGAVERKGYTIVPLRLYFNERGMAKLKIGLGKGKALHDKRATEKNRDWGRQKQRLLRDRG
ncbi:MAG: SsrA-binding protein SmpB [Aquisalinus sp.]|nr:SsrA-binding protein SmpB [Aquisalinus sp.]